MWFYITGLMLMLGAEINSELGASAPLVPTDGFSQPSEHLQTQLNGDAPAEPD